MSKLIICRGIPASGKSSWAKEYVRQQVAAGNTNVINVDRDMLRQGNGFDVTPGAFEDTVTQIIDALMRKFLSKDFTVIESSTNLNSSTVKKWLKIAKHYGAEVIFEDFDTPLEECIKRANARTLAGGHEVPEKVIRSMHTRYFKDGYFPTIPLIDIAVNFETYVPDTTKPKAFIFDVDGTLAEHNRSPYDYAQLHTDSPIQEVIRMAEDLIKGMFYTGIIVSGRPAEWASETEKWISDNSILTPKFGVDLFMRATGDNRVDSVIKYKLFMRYIAPYYNVVGVFDDRLQVISMWRQIGLRCYDVAGNDF